MLINQTPKSLNVALVYGGPFPEHDVSVISAKAIRDGLNQLNHNVIDCYWLKDRSWKIDGQKLANPENALTKADIIFPTLHGNDGENGAFSGYLSILNKPFVGCDVLGGALNMNKSLTKIIVESQGIPVLKSLLLSKAQFNSIKEPKEQHILKLISDNQLTWPIFVKPESTGSSIGINKAHNEQELSKAIEQAFLYDNNILIEQGLNKPREIEFAVLDNIDDPDNPRISCPGEITTKRDFYDYEAKYLDNATKLNIPAELSIEQNKTAKEIAISCFKALRVNGYGRVDLFLDTTTEKFYFNEINTLPGFTAGSMYPKLWEASGMPFTELLSKMIQLGFYYYQSNQDL